MQHGAGQIEHRLQVQPCIGVECGIKRRDQRRAFNGLLQCLGRELPGADALAQGLQV
ncbi:hypothetical protein D3C73_1403980 [compost metagenome]